MQSPTHYHALPDVLRLCASIQQLIGEQIDSPQRHGESRLEPFRVEVQSLSQLLGFFDRIRALNEQVSDLEDFHLRDVSRLVRRCHGTLLNLYKFLERGRHADADAQGHEALWSMDSQDVKAARFYIGFYKRTLEMALCGVNLVRRWKSRAPQEDIESDRRNLSEATDSLRLRVIQRKNLTGGSDHQESVEEMGLMRDIEQCIKSAEKLLTIDRTEKQKELQLPVRTHVGLQVRGLPDRLPRWLAEVPVSNGSIKSSSASDIRTDNSDIRTDTYASDDSEVESIEDEPEHDAGFSAEIYSAMITALLGELQEKMKSRNFNDADEICKTIMKHSKDRQARLGIPFDNEVEVDLALAEICLEQKRYQKSKKIVFRLLQSDAIDADGRFRLHLFLARAYVGRNQLSKAESYARSSLKGREAQYGREHPLTRESASILIEIYEGQGDATTAGVLRNIYCKPTLPSPPHKSALRQIARPAAPNPQSSLCAQPLQELPVAENQQASPAPSETRIRWAPDVWVNDSSINAPMNELGQTPLVYAIHQADEAYVKLNIERGANVDKPCADGIAPLMHAVILGNETMVETLLKAGAKVDSRTSNWTALHQAAEMSNLGIMKLLLAFGADTEAKSPFEYIKPKNTSEKLRAISNREPDPEAALDPKKDHKWTPLLRAAHHGNKSAVSILLDAKANIEARSPTKATPLMYACKNLHLETVDLLAIRGANIHTVDEYGWRALHHAVSNAPARSQKEALGIIALLLSHEASMNAKCKFGKTALHYAVEKSNPDTVACLITHKADIEARDLAELTPLHTAIKCRLVAMVALLLEQGADSGAMDLAGDDALAVAKHAEKKSPEIIELLVKDKKEKKEKSYAVAGRSHERKGSFSTMRRASTRSSSAAGDSLVGASKTKRWFGGRSRKGDPDG